RRFQRLSFSRNSGLVEVAHPPPHAPGDRSGPPGLAVTSQKLNALRTTAREAQALRLATARSIGVLLVGALFSRRRWHRLGHCSAPDIDEACSPAACRLSRGPGRLPPRRVVACRAAMWSP